MYAANAMSECQTFVNDVNNALQKAGSKESTICLENNIGTNNEICKGVIGRHGDPALNVNGPDLLQLCCSFVAATRHAF